MGFYHLDLDKLSEYTGTCIDELKALSYAELESRIEDMERDKIIMRNSRNAGDAEYERLVLKYFEPVKFLRHWFSDREIILACAHTGVTESSLCQETHVKPGAKFWNGNSDFIRTSMEYVKQFDQYGREFAERIRMKRDVYREKSTYQHFCQGDVILHLLYGRYPALAKFGFSAYGMTGGYDYEIYPKNGIYTSFAALMSGDVDWIVHRNREYCRRYNNGRYSPEECEKALRTDEAQEMFGIIRDIGKKECIKGHSPITINADGRCVHADGLMEAGISKTGNVKLLLEPDRYPGMKRRFKLKCAKPCTAACLAAEYMQMTNASSVAVRICHVADYLGEYGIKMEFDTAGGFVKGGIDTSNYIVYDSFGWIYQGRAELMLRIDCPELGR